MQESAIRIEEEIKRVEECQQLFRTLAYKLAIAVSHHSGEQIVIAPSMRQNVLDKEAECISLSEEREKIVKEYSKKESDKKVESELKKSLKEKSELLKELSSRLGAIAFEQSQAATLSLEVEEVIKPLVNEYTTLASKAEKHNVIAKLRFATLKRNFTSFCLRLFDALDKKGLLSTLKGERYEKLYREYLNVKSECKEIKSSIEELNKRYVDPSINSESKEKVSSKLALIQDELKEAAIAYGIYLFDNGAKWVSAETSEAELDLISLMLEERKKEEEATRSIASLKARAEADDYRDLIARNNQNIVLLEHEIARLSHQIEEIKSENMIHMKHIQELEAKH